MVFKGLETVRTDWTPLAQRFQQELYLRVFRNEPYQDYVRETIDKLMAGELDAQLVYRKRLRRPLHEYQRNIPPHVRAARLADEQNLKRGRPAQYQNRGAIKYVWTVNGPEPWITSSRRWITNTILPASYNPWRKEFFPSLKIILLHY